MPDQLTSSPALEGIYKSMEFAFKDSIIECKFEKNELAVKINKQDMPAILKFLKEEKGFNVLNDMICLDNFPPSEGEKPSPQGQKRFSILYQLYRFPGFDRIRIAVDIGKNEDIDSIIAIYKSSDWAEREIYDMFGVKFTGRPDLRRIYMWDDFEGFPLRKDFPLEGRK